MPYTMMDLVEQTRDNIDDGLAGRFTDEKLLVFANDALLRLRLYRPDMFVGSFTSLPEQLALSTAVPFPDEVVPAVIDYMCARTDLKNDEAALRARAPQFYQLFTKDTEG
jgi:hypothetical protein